MPTPHNTTSYSEPTTVLLLPAFLLIENVTPATVPTLLTSIISVAPTTTSPLTPFSIPASLPAPLPEGTPAAIKDLTTRACPHKALILLCSQKTRDARCGQSAPLLRREFMRHLQPRGLWRDLDDERPGGVGIYFISHVGGHKYSANVMVYRRRDAFGLDGVGKTGEKKEGEGDGDGEGKEGKGEGKGGEERKKEEEGKTKEEEELVEEEGDVGAAQCIWLARVKPEDCEKIVEFTVLRGKVVKPERQLRGGFDRGKGLLSW